MLPLKITVRDIPNSNALEDHIRKKAEKLEQFCQKVISCRVVVDLPQKHKHQGKLYTARIDFIIPGKELAVTHKYNEDVYIAVRDAFNALERQLEGRASRRRNNIRLRMKDNGIHYEEE